MRGALSFGIAEAARVRRVVAAPRAAGGALATRGLAVAVAVVVVGAAVSAGCVGSTRARRPTAYLANAVLLAAGTAALAYGATRLGQAPRDQLEALERDAGGDVLYFLTALTGAVMMGGATYGVVATMTSEQAEADLVLRSVGEASGGPGETLPASAVHDPGPEVRKLVLEARLLAAGGDCHGAIAADRKIKQIDPAWHRAVFSRDATVAACRVLRTD